MPAERALALIEERYGLRAGPDALARVHRALGGLSTRLGLTVAATVARAEVDPSLLREIARALIVSESYFLRDRAQLDATVAFLLRLASARPAPRPRVWSAGCARGEEPISLLMLLHEAAGPAAMDRVEITASDLDGEVIETARSGSYRDWSLRDLDPVRRAAFFTPEGPGDYRLRPGIGERVRWIHGGIQEQLAITAPASFDLIVFRNVAIYFSAGALDAVYEGFARVLAPGGRLVLGLADPPPKAGFTRVDDAPPGVLAVRSGASRPPPAHARPSAAIGRRARGPARPRQAAAAPPIERASPAAPGSADRARQWLAEGRAAVAEGHPERAIESLRRLLFLDPEHLLGRFWYAVALTAAGDEARGKAQARALAEALRERPRDEPIGGELTAGALATAAAQIAGEGP